MEHQKSTAVFIFGTISLGGCGGHPMRPKLNLKNKGEISRPNEYKITSIQIQLEYFKSNSTWIFLSFKNTFCPRTLCRTSPLLAEKAARGAKYITFGGPDCIWKNKFRIYLKFSAKYIRFQHHLCWRISQNRQKLEFLLLMFHEYRKVAVIPLIEHGQFSIDYLLFWLDWGCCLRIIRIVCTVKLGIKELFD